MQITISTTINAPIDKVWNGYTNPDHIVKWNFASDDWHCPSAENDLRVGGKLKSRMEAKDGSFGFDFEATYTEVIPNEKLEYTLDDGRKVITEFEDQNNQTIVTTIFEAESENSPEMQREGWQSILDNFKKHVETTTE